jgi:DNA-binding response OmpR family regulator
MVVKCIAKSPAMAKMRRMRVLVVEDDRKTAAFICKALKAENFAVDMLNNGDEALAAVSTSSFDALVLDIMLAGRDGLSVLRQLRIQGNRIPVLLLSARGEVNERIEGLDAGADDYLAKPFALEELLARVRALVRRGGEARPVVLRVGDLKLDTTTHVAERGGRAIELTAREYRLLEHLMRSAGRICTRMMLIEKVWDYSFDPGSNIVDVYVRKLRDKIDRGANTSLVHTVRGVGYVMRKEP